MISASFTETGAPAYLTPAGDWSPYLQNAAAIASEAERDALLERVVREERVICDAYFFDVRIESSGIDPLSAREKIRATGPTTRGRRPD